MSETKCQVFPSGQVAWHQWKQGALPGDPCQCGERVLEGGSASEVELAQDLLRTKQEVVEVKNRLIDSQDRLQASLLDHKKTLEELVEVRAVLAWCSEHVVVVVAVPESGWVASVKWDSFTGDTLYQALHQAWVAREVKL